MLSINWKAFRFFWNLMPQYWISNFALYIVSIASTYINLYLSGALLNYLTDYPDIKKIVGMLQLILFINFVINITKNILNNRMKFYTIKFKEKETVKWNEKSMRIEYSEIENTSFRQLKRNIKESSKINGYGKNCYISSLNGMVDSLVSICTAVALLISLIIKISNQRISVSFFVYVITIAMCIILNVICTFMASKKSMDFSSKLTNDIVANNRIDGTINSYSLGKDIRLYRQNVFISNIQNDIYNCWYRLWKKLSRKQYIYSLPNLFFNALESILSYMFIGQYVIDGVLPIGSLVCYVGYINNFASAVANFSNNFALFKDNTKYVEQYLSYYEFKEFNNTSLVDSYNHRKPIIKVSNICYSYDGGNTQAISNVSLTLNHNKKYAIVGKNGSGKTTFVKLLCHLYSVQSGCIEYYGVNIDDIGCEDYWKKCSALFQDYKLLAFSLCKNIAVSERASKNKILQLFKDVGFFSRYEQLEEGMDTILYRNFDKNGIEISGGESQKIAMARALYKKAKIVIFDEPTASLDPVTEMKIYDNLNNNFINKTLIIVSHRLAACKFCDSIIVFDQGKIVQFGTHEELMRDTSGMYYKLWGSQASQYSN